MAVGAFSTFVIFTGLTSLFPTTEKPFVQEITEKPKVSLIQFQPEKACEQPGFYVNPQDCNSFYRCAEHYGNNIKTPAAAVLIKFRFTCPGGTVFDESTQTCNYPYEVENLDEICYHHVTEYYSGVYSK